MIYRTEKSLNLSPLLKLYTSKCYDLLRFNDMENCILCGKTVSAPVSNLHKVALPLIKFSTLNILLFL